MMSDSRVSNVLDIFLQDYIRSAAKAIKKELPFNIKIDDTLENTLPRLLDPILGGITGLPALKTICLTVQNPKEERISGIKLEHITPYIYLTKVLNDLNTKLTPQTGGSIFESFIAGVVGGKVTRSGKDKTQPADVVMGGETYSVKFLTKGADSTIKGSVSKYFESFLSENPDKISAPTHMIFGHKTGDTLTIYISEIKHVFTLMLAKLSKEKKSSQKLDPEILTYLKDKKNHDKAHEIYTLIHKTKQNFRANAKDTENEKIFQNLKENLTALKIPSRIVEKIMRGDTIFNNESLLNKFDITQTEFIENLGDIKNILSFESPYYLPLSEKGLIQLSGNLSNIFENKIKQAKKSFGYLDAMSENFSNIFGMVHQPNINNEKLVKENDSLNKNMTSFQKSLKSLMPKN